jgi:hypothetical protein
LSFFVKFLKNHLFKKSSIALICLTALAFAAFVDYKIAGRARRTFVFYTVGSRQETVEDRMLYRVEGLLNEREEGELRMYISEALLGPVSPNSLPLFSTDTRLISLLYRDGAVHADFTGAALSIPDSIAPEGYFRSWRIFRDCILRNFGYVKEVNFYIEGNPVFYEAFRETKT